MNVSFLYVVFYLQNVVEKKLSQMILDKKLHGELTVLQLLKQQQGCFHHFLLNCFIVFEKSA